MLSELPRATLNKESNQTARTMPIGINNVDERQSLQTFDGLLLSDTVLPFSLANTHNTKMDGDSHRSDIVCQQASSHGYNTRSKPKMTNPVQGGDPHLKPNHGHTNSEVNPDQGQSKAKVKPH